MDEGHISPTADGRGLYRLTAPVLKSTADGLAEVMTTSGKSLTEVVRRVIAVRYQVDEWREGGAVVLHEPTDDARELFVPNVTPIVDEPLVGLSCNLNAETAAALEMFRRRDLTPLGESLRRSLAVYREVHRNQEIGGRVEATLADGSKHALHLIGSGDTETRSAS